MTKSLSASDDAMVAPAPADNYPRYRWAIVPQLWLHQQIGFMLFAGVGILLPSMREELQFGPVEAGWLGAVRSLGQLLVFPGSILLVRFAPNRVYGLCLAAAALAAFAQSAAPGLALLMLGMLAYSVGVSFSLIPGALVRLQWVPPREMATVQGIGQAFGAIGAMVVFALLPSVLEGLGGWRGALAAQGAVLCIFVLVWALTQRERITERYRAAMSAEHGLRSVGVTLKRREFLLLGLAFAGGASAYMTAMLFLPTYFSEERGLSLQTAGAIVSVIPLGGLLAALSTGLLSDRVGRRKPFVWPAGVVLPVLYWVLLGPTPELLLWPVALALGYFAWAPFAVINTMPFELPGISPSQVAMGQSLVQTIGTIGVLIGPVVAGAVTEFASSYRAGMLSLSVLPVLFVLICFWLPETGPAARR